MSKAVISNRIYMDLPEKKKELFDALTYQLATGEGRYLKIETIRNYKMVTPKIVSIPSGRMDLIPEGYEIADKRVINFADFPDPIFPLYEDQQVVYDQVDSSCFINALVGWGKSYTALHIAHKLGQKTLVVTHTSALRDQWINNVKEMFNIEPGVIGAGEFKIDSPIVIGNVQSLNLKLDQIGKEFGTLALDEAHHTPASTFTGIIDSSHATYKIGLSGTMVRRDGKHVFFRDFFGDKVYKPAQSNTINPTIHLYPTNMKLPVGRNWADKVNKLLYDPEYQQLIAYIAAKHVSMGHKVLVIGDRTEFLEEVHKLLGDASILVIGETKDREEVIKEVSEGDKRVICGSRSIFAEGISVNSLSCVILSTPIANAGLLEQIIGRVMRLSPGKLDPVVIDMQFRGVAEKKQTTTRLSFYFEKGWKVVGLQDA